MASEAALLPFSRLASFIEILLNVPGIGVGKLGYLYVICNDTTTL